MAWMTGVKAGMGRLKAFNIEKWVSENRHLLKPPVCNKLLYNNELKVMLVGGPNKRTDYHIEAGEEWFYQLEGEMILKVVENGEFYDVKIGQGETFCLPGGVAHSPQRMDGSVGIVVERERREGEMDALVWFCGNVECREMVFRKEFFCRDLGKDLVPIIEEYYGDEEKRRCGKCGFVETQG